MFSNSTLMSRLSHLLVTVKYLTLAPARSTGSLLKIKVLVALLVTGALLQFAGVSLAFPSATATRVYGQSGNFTTTTSSNDTIVSADTLDTPTGVATDSSGGVYIVDFFNSRVLYYAAGSTTATRVYGQDGSFTSNDVNNGGLSATSLNNTIGVTVDSTGVYIADTNNNRVLFYPGTSTTATRVYGQNGSFTDDTTNNGGVTADSLSGPSGVAVDSTGVYIADTYNNRILYYAGTSTTATRVYGQNGSFTTNDENSGGLSATSLFQPYNVAVDSTGLYVADFLNNRVLFYPGTSTTATRVYGQNGSFTDDTTNNGGVTANSLFEPIGVALDSTGVYIADTSNQRVLYYAGTSTTATQVFGQNGSFTNNSSNNGGVSASSLSNPYDVEVDSLGNLYIADTANNRVLYYPAQTGIATTITLNSSPNPSQSGQSVTFTATVSPSAATGSVTFNFDNGTLVNANLSAGAATYITDTLSVGTHPVIATYNGDASYLGSSSATLNHLVQNGSCTPVEINVADGGDNGTGTLRVAIDQANVLIANCSVTINLNVPSIVVNTALPALTNTTANTINVTGACTAGQGGRGQPGTSISAGASFSGPGLNLSSHINLSGVAVSGFQGYGVALSGSNNVVSCSWIGTNNGTSAAPNVGGGILIAGNNNSLGTASGILSGNLIGGNGGVGVQVNSGAIDNQAYFNLVGLQIDATQGLKNSGGGIKISTGGKIVFHPGNKVKA